MLFGHVKYLHTLAKAAIRWPEVVRKEAGQSEGSWKEPMSRITVSGRVSGGLRRSELEELSSDGARVGSNGGAGGKP